MVSKTSNKKIIQILRKGEKKYGTKGFNRRFDKQFINARDRGASFKGANEFALRKVGKDLNIPTAPISDIKLQKTKISERPRRSPRKKTRDIQDDINFFI